MAISWDPKNKPSALGSTQEPDAQNTAKAQKAGTPEAMSKPAAMVDDPTRSDQHPTRPQPANASSLEEALGALRAALRSKRSEQVRAAQQALAWCSGYALRRSRGARRRGVELLEEVSDSGIEGSDLASVLGEILQAEGKLHELSDAATGEACHRLVTLLMALEEQPS
ncbi:MAG: hypothetical protein AAFQ82_23595 [Myxococcota bacterium]